MLVLKAPLMQRQLEQYILGCLKPRICPITTHDDGAQRHVSTKAQVYIIAVWLSYAQRGKFDFGTMWAVPVLVHVGIIFFRLLGLVATG